MSEKSQDVTLAPRVIGAETEYWLFGKARNILSDPFFGGPGTKFISLCFPSECSLPNVYQGSSETFIQSPGGFSANGARVYIDSGEHIEYATVEGRGAYAARVNEMAGDMLMEQMVRYAAEHWSEIWPELMPDMVPVIYKTNTDAVHHSSGFHENYLVRRETFNRLVSSKSGAGMILAAHLISRILYAGNGIFVHGAAPNFRLSQRAGVMHLVLNMQTTNARAIINQRDEPHGDPEKYGRLHLIIGDSTLLDVGSFLKYWTTALVLDMIEDGFITEPLCTSEEEIMKALSVFNSDYRLRAESSLGDKNWSIVSLQKRFREDAGKFVTERGRMNAEAELGFLLWDEVLECAERPDAHLLLAPLVDWAAKLAVAEGALARRNFGLDVPIDQKLPGRGSKTSTVFSLLKKIDLEFHSLDDGGIARKLIGEGKAKTLISQDEVGAAMTYPSLAHQCYPEALRRCRGHARADWMKRISQIATSAGKPILLSVDWAPLKCEWKGIENSKLFNLILLDPLDERDVRAALS